MENFTNKKVLIFGAGKSGLAAAVLLSGSGADICLYDSNSKGKLNEKDIKEKLTPAYTGRIVLGALDSELRSWADYLIISPGVPKDLPEVLDITAHGAKLIGEVELAYYYSKGRIIAVTGTNGKTTTTALTGHIMKQVFPGTIVVGNIGIPYTEMVRTTTDDSVTVAEMSSFQLDTIESFRPDVSMILNITPDHLDRHHTMDNYINAKFNVALNQGPDDICILNYEDSILRERASGLKCRPVWFSSRTRLEEGVYYEQGHIYYGHDGSVTDICETDRLQIIGEHNWENAMAAIAAAIYMKVPLDVLREALYSFKPVEHRIEYVATRRGVKYYNDSKGTNPDASIKAVKAMTAPTVLIGGGYDKGSAYDEWIESFGTTIKHLVLMGQTADKIAECARRHGFDRISFVNSMEEAVDLCSRLAEPGETVLLSPCCASWGMFNNYEERGRIFKDLVNALEQ